MPDATMLYKRRAALALAVRALVGMIVHEAPAWLTDAVVAHEVELVEDPGTLPLRLDELDDVARRSAQGEAEGTSDTKRLITSLQHKARTVDFGKERLRVRPGSSPRVLTA